MSTHKRGFIVFTRAPRERGDQSRCGLQGIVAQIHCHAWAKGRGCCGLQESSPDTLLRVRRRKRRRCGLQGIVARIHSIRASVLGPDAVACRESSLRYTCPIADVKCAVACRESSLGYTCRNHSIALTCCGLQGIVARIHLRHDQPESTAVACRESSLGYTN